MNLLGVTPQVWFPVITLVLGFALQAFLNVLTDHRASRRERDARRDQRLDAMRSRRREFQRTTLLEAQDVMSQLMRLTVRAYLEDLAAFRKSGSWHKQLLTEDVDEGIRKCQADMARLRARIRSEQVRRLINQVVSLSVDAGLAENETNASFAIGSMANTGNDLNEQIGVLLRTLEDEEEHLLT